ncbi:MAG: hypothetical protein ACI9T7_003551 [Oleiphilaceae bacterium]|jgi:hypothetical protein
MYDQINLGIKPSFFISAIITVACLSATILITSLDIPFSLMFLFIMAFLGVNFYYVRLFGSLTLINSITHIRLYQKELTLFDSQNHQIRAELCATSLITTWGCVLIFSSITEKKTKIVLLCKHNIRNQNDFRRFRVWTKFGHSTQQNKTLIE